MSEQISLPGFDAAPAPATTPKSKPKASQKALKDPNATDRLFFAVLPDADAIAAIRQCTQQLQSRRSSGQLVIDGRLHISLLGLDDFPAEEVPEVIAAFSLAAATISLPAFDVCFDRVLTFGNQAPESAKQRPWVLVESTANPGLPALQKALFAALLGKKAPSSFSPHLTLLYDGKPLPATDVAPVTWKVREFVLVRSKIGNNRRPYDILERWALTE